MKYLVVRTLLRLYPADWRREYGPELMDMLLVRPLTAAIIADVLWNGLRRRLPATEPATILGLVMMLAVLIELLQNKSIISPQTSNLYILTLVAGGAWTHLRHGGRLSRSGRAAVRIAFIAGIPVMFTALLMLSGVPLQMSRLHGAQDYCWIRVSEPSTQWLAQAIQSATCPPAPLGVLFSPLFALPASWLWGMAGGALGRWITRGRRRPMAT
jgi:hypothetical protein